MTHLTLASLWAQLEVYGGKFFSHAVLKDRKNYFRWCRWFLPLSKEKNPKMYFSNVLWGALSYTQDVVVDTVTTDSPHFGRYNGLDCHISSQAKQYQTILWEKFKCKWSYSLSRGSLHQVQRLRKSRKINSETEVPELSALLLPFRTRLGIKLENSFHHLPVLWGHRCFSECNPSTLEVSYRGE